jgi:hypothetical protein
MKKAIVALVFMLILSGCSLFLDNGEQKPNAAAGGGEVVVVPVDPDKPDGPDGIPNSGDEFYEIHVYTVTTKELVLHFPKPAPMMGRHASALLIGGGGGGGAGQYDDEPGGPGGGGGAGEVVYIEDFVFEKESYPVVIAGAGGAGIVGAGTENPSKERPGQKGQQSSFGDVTAEGGGGGGSFKNDVYIAGVPGGSSGGAGHNSGASAAAVSRGSNGTLRTKNSEGALIPAVIRRFGNAGGSAAQAAAGGGGAGSAGANPDSGSGGGGAGLTFQTLGLGKIADALRRAAGLEADGAIIEAARIDDSSAEIINVSSIPELETVVQHLLGGFGGGGSAGPRDIENTEGTATNGGGKLLKKDGAFNYTKAAGLNFTGGGGAGGGGRAGTVDEHSAGFPGGSGCVIVWFYWQQLEEPVRIRL